MQTVFEYNKDRIDKLLKLLKYYKDTLPEKEFTGSFVTKVTRLYGLKPIDLENGHSKKVEDITEKLEKNLMKAKIKAVPLTHWLNIWTRSRIVDEKLDFIKLYCSIDSEHLEKGIQMIMEFMLKNNIMHESKVFYDTRTDNVVIRLEKEDYIGARKVIDFINNSEYLQNGMNEINPLTPCIGHVGCTRDLDRYNECSVTFNKSANDMLVEYVSSNQSVSAEGFKQFLLSKRTNYFSLSSPLCDNVFDTSLIDKINSIQNENNNSKKENVVDMMSGCFEKLLKSKLHKKDIQAKASSVIVETDIDTLFDKAVSVTMVNHGIDHAVDLVSRLLNGDSTGYGRVSRNYANSNRLENYRNLVSNLSYDDIRKVLSSYKDCKDPAKQYVDDIVNKKINVINEIYSATVKKYPGEDIVVGLKQYIESGIATGFTNDNRRLRSTLQYVPKEEILYFIKCYLVKLGYDMSILDEESILYTYDAIIKDIIELDKQRV